MHRVVIVGGGAGGLELATRLGKTLGRSGRARITLVDANLTHIWKPLLHEVAAGSLDAANDELSYLAQAKWNHFDFIYGRMTGLDRRRHVIQLAGWKGMYAPGEVPPTEVRYDTLVLAVGSVCNDFGTPGVREHCIFLDSRHDAERLRREMLERRLAAVTEGRSHRLRVAVIGGGATGVELSAELCDAQRKLAQYNHQQGAEDLDITLIEAGPRLLPALPEQIGASVEKELRNKLGIRVLTGTPVKRAEADGLFDAQGNKIDAEMMVWAAGIRAPGFLRELDGLESNHLDQLLVRPTLQTTRDDDIFAFGDCASCPLGGDATGNVPPRAQAAHQQAELLAQNVASRLEGKPLRPFQYHDHGSLVSLASYNTFGNLLGNRVIEGWVAHFFYASLYRMHQSALYGHWRTTRLMVGGFIAKNTRPLLKLH
ncbi:NAD(P)/FAD-dependent oxidoreductase [Dyella mobilis]|uniref:NAD(P)/FAD-dependent oxidoreductase n=1 Tax=Dyella mobilis TaxID=1849582 RepID=A0ABS2KJJ4_9GAMM|nr:NAD(P)/FAD-dependent oxidoreductase [Dyella mobilis]MBM7131328.1 NAD(P)/FAD-dependent oxidoreductase [Dyella mobilis]GLQ98735.1 NADH dehydrogenase [Dyella mobilis]